MGDVAIGIPSARTQFAAVRSKRDAAGVVDVERKARKVPGSPPSVASVAHSASAARCRSTESHSVFVTKAYRPVRFWSTRAARVIDPETEKRFLLVARRHVRSVAPGTAS